MKIYSWDGLNFGALAVVAENQDQARQLAVAWLEQHYFNLIDDDDDDDDDDELDFGNYSDDHKYDLKIIAQDVDEQDTPGVIMIGEIF